MPQHFQLDLSPFHHHSRETSSRNRSKSLNKRGQKLLALFIVFLIALTAALYWRYEPPLLTPLSSLTTFTFINQLPPPSEGKVVYGFVPYWNLDETTIQPELTHLSYFSLTIGSNGSIITRGDEGLEPGYRHLGSEDYFKLSNQIEAQGGDVEIVLAQFNNDDIVSLLTIPQAQKNLLASLDQILLAYPVSGVNIDIEYTGEVNEKLRASLVDLMKGLRTHLTQKYRGVQLSIDVYAGAAGKPQLWNIPEIAEQVDFIIIMAYDFHRRSSPQAGPVAPLFGGRDLWNSDINQHLHEFLEVVPRQKILLGVPFYGYEWQTTSREAQAFTLPDTGATATYKRVQDILQQSTSLQVQEKWHDSALSPYLSYVKNGETRIIYYEDARSLAYKLDYINQLDLGGVAIWALGYEADTRELWDVIAEKL